jgi:peptide/nickel transport system ATP-binding protein
MSVSVLQVENLTVSLPRGADRREAVSGVSFDIAPGQVVCLVGESGSGKSIIAHTVMGLTPRTIRATAGEVRLKGEALLSATPERLRQLRGQAMSMIFQEPMTALNPVMTCGSQIDELLVQHTAMPARERRTRILDILGHVRLPDPERLYRSYPHQVSGGQRQRIMIAMALILGPALLIADEPTTALDVTTQAEILRLIRDLQRERQTAVLFITHDLGVVSEIADQVAVLQRGILVESGTARDVFMHPQHPYTRALLNAVPSLTPRKKVKAQDLEPTVLDRGDVHLQTRHLSKVYESGGWLRRRSGVTAVDAVDLDIRRGDTVGIVGESGSGKSTLARLLVRLIDASAGEISVDTLPVTALRGKAAHQFRRRVQMVFQDPYRSLNPRRTVGAAIAEGPRNFGVTRIDAWQLAAELLDLVKLSPASLHRYPHEFSGGQRQRICIARALAVRPEILIADEAVSALDVSIQAQILLLLDDLQQRFNLTLVFITHDLRVAAQICNRVVVMHQGRVVEQGPLAEVFERPQHAYTRALLDAAPGRAFEVARSL